MTHWFPLGLDVLRHKTEVLERYCEEIGRDPATIRRTMATPVIVAVDERDGRRRSSSGCRRNDGPCPSAPPEQVAEALRPYLDAGFSGFTFNNPVLPTPEAIGAAGELLRLLD